MPSIRHLKHVFLSQPAKGSLQLKTGKHTARQTPIRAGGKQQLGGRNKGEKGRSFQSSAPISAVGYPYSPLVPGPCREEGGL